MNVIHPSEHSHATTTEELIVQYLDGELVRKELETMLFERLAQSAEARMLLREYLTVRGAIRSSLEDERFQLSSDLDARTRSRIEQMLEHGVLESASPAMNFEGDAPAVRTNAVDRSLKLSARRSGAYRWSLRPGIAALALLLAIGTTWFLTRSTTTSSPQMAAHSTPSVSPQTAPVSTANKTPSAPIEQYASANTTTPAKPDVREIIRYVEVPAKRGAQPAASIAQNAPAASAAQQQQPEADDPAAIMISHRYAKILGAEEKHEIVVSSQDRL
ncbi:MAG TPA: hypothetical protein VG537_05230 [Candidatus Kapabacteria bacterium]|jgi:hypothetical protein|nr:hypothetical protein [Candidatus Kapabacteria bacterium]